MDVTDSPDMNISSRFPKEMKKWTELKGENSWTLFKVIAEMVEGFEKHAESLMKGMESSPEADPVSWKQGIKVRLMPKVSV